MGNDGIHSRKLTTQEAAALLGIGTSTLEKLRVFGGGPRYAKLGNAARSRVVYEIGDLNNWLESRKRTSTVDNKAVA